MAQAKTAFVRGVLPASSTLDLTEAGFGTPAAVLLFTGGVTDDTLSDVLYTSYGMYDGTNNYCATIVANDATGATDTKRNQRADIVLASISHFTSAFDGTATASFITDGVRLTTSGTFRGRQVIAVLIGGAGVQAKCGLYGNTTGTSELSVTGVGFPPTTLFALGTGSGTTSTFIEAHSLIQFGCANQTASGIQEYWTGFSAKDNVGIAENHSYISDAGFWGRAWNGALEYNLSLNSFDTDGFSFTPSANPAGADFGYLALYLPGASLDLLEFPATTGNESITTGFAVDGVITSVLANSTTINTAVTADTFCHSVGGFNATDTFTVCTVFQDAVATAQAGTLTSDQFRVLDDTGSGDEIVATTSVSATGYAFTLSTNPSVLTLGWALAVNGESNHVATVTVPNTNVTGSHTDFPLLVDLSDLPASFWNTVANGGGDIRVFEDQAGGLVEVPREVVSCVTTGGANTGELWVKIPLLTATSDCVLQIHADGTSDYSTTATYGRNEVWSDYEFVSHDGGGTDSSGTLSLTANGGVTSGDTTGQIGAATNYDGANDYFTGAISSPGASDYTMQSWVSPDDSATFNPYFNVGQRDGAKPSIGIDLASSGGFNFFVQDNSSGAQFDIITGGSYSGGSSWYKHDGTLDKDGNLTVYKDGSSVQSQAVTSNSDGSIVVTDVWIGNRWNLSTYFDGQLDELRIIKAALSANWITTEYANQSDPGTFYAATDPSAGGGTNYDVSVTFGSEGGVTMTGLVGFGADFTVDMSAGIDSSALADASADFTAAAQAGAVIESRADFLVSITTGAEAGQAMTGAVTAGGTVLASLLVSAEMGATATAEAQALASMLTSAQAGQVMSGSVDGVTNIEAAMLAGYDAGASAEAQADALAALLVSYGAGLSAFEDSSIPASMVLSAAADMGMTATIGAEVSFITAAETDAVFSGQVDASAVIEVSTEAAATMIASAASSAGIEVASIANIEIFASSFSGDILTPEHRIYRVSFELRTFSVEPRVSTFTVQ
jgi:hypothetical protein